MEKWLLSIKGQELSSWGQETLDPIYVVHKKSIVNIKLVQIKSKWNWNGMDEQ